MALNTSPLTANATVLTSALEAIAAGRPLVARRLLKIIRDSDPHNLRAQALLCLLAEGRMTDSPPTCDR
jgi:hypothetical protein